MSQELIRCYKLKFGLPAEAKITEEMCLEHWDLEKRLATELLESTPETRSKVFKHCYDRLYSQLKWHDLYYEYDPEYCAVKYRNWIAAIGEPPKRIYEVGSGRGELINYLADIGHTCRATEISTVRCTEPRGKSFQNLCWGTTDGVHLDIFEPLETYDLILSRQVIEHLHPDDVGAHFDSVKKILVVGGLYILSTPHSFTGPHDVSEIFKCDKPQGVHLREYTYRELIRIIREAGFTNVFYVIPYKLRKLAFMFHLRNEEQIEKLGVIYLKIMLIMEKFLSVLPSLQRRRACMHLLTKAQIFKDHIFLAARK